MISRGPKIMGIRTAAFVVPCLLACLATNSLARGKSQREKKKNTVKKKSQLLNQCCLKEDENKEELHNYNLVYLS